MTGGAIFRGFPLEDAVAERAEACGIALDERARRILAEHAREVAGADPRLHLTSIDDPREFVARHPGEALEGAAVVDPRATGVVLDLGSGNGYPGIPVSIVRPGLELVLSESSARKAEFLEALLRRVGVPASASVIGRHVQRAADLEDVSPLRLLTVRGVGAWEKVLPKLAPALAADGELLLWAGERVEEVLGRRAWKRFDLVSRTPLAGRDRSWVWRFRPHRP